MLDPFAFVDLLLELPVTLGDTPHPHPVGHEEPGGHAQQRQQAEPPRRPEGRCDDQLDGGALLVPDAVVVRTFYPKRVDARIQVRVRRRARGAGVDPVLVKVFQHVGILVFRRGPIVQRGEGEAEDRLIVCERDRLGFDDVFLQGCVVADGNRFVEDLEVGNHHRRDDGIGLDAVGVEHVEALDAAEEQLPVAAF